MAGKRSLSYSLILRRTVAVSRAEGRPAAARVGGSLGELAHLARSQHAGSPLSGAVRVADTSDCVRLVG